MLIGVIVAVVLVAAIVPTAYAFAQRAAITSLEFKVNRFELTDVDFSETNTVRTVQQLVTAAENPDSLSVSQIQSLGSQINSFSSPETIAIDVITNTNLIFSLFVDVRNPSSFEAIIDRAQVDVKVNGYDLHRPLMIAKQAKIAPESTTTVELEGIAVNGRDIANILVNLASNDFVLTFDFAIASYFPTLFGDVSIPVDINAQLYMAPPKPVFDRNNGYQLIDYNTNSYRLYIGNSNQVPISGKLQVGVMKGNFLCDPGCLPVDNGFLTFVRINMGSLDGIQVMEYPNIHLDAGNGENIEITNPDVRSDSKSAFILRWSPDYGKVPYVITSEIGGIKHTTTGEFQSSTLSTVRKVVYNLARDFGYVGSLQFQSADKSTSISISVSNTSVTAGNTLTISGKLVNRIGEGISGALIYIKDEDPLNANDELGTTHTDSSGRYSFSWKAKSMDPFDSSVEVYAVFEADSSFQQSVSRQVVVNVNGSTSQGGTSAGTSETLSKPAAITITPSSYSEYYGNAITFTGRLTDSNGNGISNAVVYLKQDITLGTDRILSSTYTDALGRYSMNWNVDRVGTTDVYAIFEGDASHQQARSVNVSITGMESSPSSTFHETSLNFSASFTSVSKGDTVTFSGRLVTLDGLAVSNAQIYIRDEDTGSGDDLIASVYTDSNGYYSYNWTAERMDPFDSVVEAYAIFDGASNLGSARSVQIDIQVN